MPRSHLLPSILVLLLALLAAVALALGMANTELAAMTDLAR
jgi:hypothetical protein